MFHSGVHPTLRLRTREGFEVVGTANHPVLCLERVAGVPLLQWRLLEELRPGAIVVIDRHIRDDAGAATEGDLAAAFLAGAFVAEGWVSERRAGFNNVDKVYFDAVLRAYDAVVGGRHYTYSRRIASGSLLHELDVHDLASLRRSPLAEAAGLRSADKPVCPSSSGTAEYAMKQAFLQALFEGDGCVSLLPRATVQISYSTRSRQLAPDVQLLLLEFGIVSRQSHARRGEIKVVITNRRDARLFERRVGFWGAKQEKLESVMEAIPRTSRALSHDHVPFLAEYVRGAERSPWLRKYNIDRFERWERDGTEILIHIESSEVRSVIVPLVDGGYYYATVESITDAGEQPVYSVRVVSDSHAFSAGGFVNHNTEAKLAPLAMRLLGEIDEDTVDMEPTYDGDEQQPVCSPRFPNLLVNGVGGIAVGMATNIPPHNLGEMIDATRAPARKPRRIGPRSHGVREGSRLPDRRQILGQWDQRDVPARPGLDQDARRRRDRGAPGGSGSWSAVPYQTSAEVIGQKIAELVTTGASKASATCAPPRRATRSGSSSTWSRDANPQVVLNQLYKHTPMQTNFARTWSRSSTACRALLDLRRGAEGVRRAPGRGGHAPLRVPARQGARRAHILEGLLKALDMIDAIIRSSGTARRRGGEQASLAPFAFSEEQAQHILDMPLRRLAQLERQRAARGVRRAAGHDRRPRAILADHGSCAGDQGRAADVRAKYANDRRDRDHARPRRDRRPRPHRGRGARRRCCRKGGYVKTVQIDEFRGKAAAARASRGPICATRTIVEHLLTSTAHSYLLFFSNRGRVYRLRAHEIPMKDRTAADALVNLLALAARRAHRSRHRYAARTKTARTCSSPPATAW